MIASGGTLSITSATGNTILEAERTLQINSGATATMGASALLYMSESAQVQNAGSFNANGNEASSAGIYVNGGSGQLFHNTGTLTRNGTGSFHIAVPFENAGVVQISKGILQPTSYPQSSGGTLGVHIGGTEPGIGFGQLSVEATATLAGTLEITTESAFKPKAGQKFRIINAQLRSGTFSSIKGTEAGSGLTYQVEYDGTGVTLTVVSGVTLPTVITKAASAIAQTTATLNATVNPNGSNVSKCEFEYGTSIIYDKTAPCASLPGSGTSAVAVSAAISGLSANTTYHFRIVATNGGGTREGLDESFNTNTTTTEPPPTVITKAASAIAQTTATLNATVNPNGSNVSKCEFEYGTSIIYDKTAPCASLPGSGTSAVAVSAAISGLSANTTYHFRIVATNGGGTREGLDESFNTNTTTTEPPPTVITKAASAIAQTTATLNATVNPNGSNVSKCEFEYGTSIIYDKTAPCASLPGSGTSAVAVSAAISGLSANTTYHFRIVATNGGGTREGSDETTKTLAAGRIEPTTTSTSLSGGGQSGSTITVPEGAAVTDKAKLSGENAALATGEVSYKVYSDSACTKLVVNAGTVRVTGDFIPASNPQMLARGTYYWQASYSGDSSNGASKSTCGSEVEKVTAVAPPITAAPKTIKAVEGGAFCGVVATFKDPNKHSRAGEYTATIDWGDGSSTTVGTISGKHGSFSVSGGHTYDEEGSYTITVTITDIYTPSNTATARSTANVADDDHDWGRGHHERSKDAKRHHGGECPKHGGKDGGDR